MTVHASVELIEAVRGVCPPSGPGLEDPPMRGFGVACGAPRNPSNVPLLACTDWAEVEDAGEPSEAVDCAACIRLMREADPVRWDALESRGLVKL